MDSSIEKDIEKVERLVNDEKIHCLIMASKIFVDLRKWIEEFFETKSKAQLTVSEMLDFTQNFKWMSLAFLTVMANRIENHQFIAKLTINKFFVIARSN